ncbi:MBL fold metallo-hydrolase [Dactylosporangium sp. NPDC000555]|uniref:MBL fold metallo-hydrolase n=1 Tax=Dactylosporangium sp. NPDC000555 TaxID=3154260 RepID=UPI00332AA6D2
MSTSPLSVDVFVTPIRPYAGGASQGPGDEPTWAPMSSTLIAGEHDAILIDALMTNGQADALAAWAKGFGKRITGIYITHGHSDHWLGLTRLLEHFPEARGFATAEVAARAAWEAEMNKTTQYWTSRFPGELPEAPVVPEALAEPEFELDGHLVRAVSVGQGDTEHSAFFHVPSAGAVVAGDIVYNDVHMMQLETNEEKREAWIASLDAIAALGPKVVVAGHKRAGSPDLPEHIAASQRYLRDFTRIANQRDTAEDLVAGMMELHGDRDNPHTLWISARAAVANRA